MPELDMGKIDTTKLPATTHADFEYMLYTSQRKYFWLMFLSGGFFFLFSWVV